jgi:hypothetical protein
MAQLVAPRPIPQALLDQQRPPILLELGAAPRRATDWLHALYIDPPRLRRPSPWKHDFGLETTADRDYYPYRSLARIAPQDVQRFIDRYYVPANLTLVVTGGVSSAAAGGRWRSASARSHPSSCNAPARRAGASRDVTISTPHSARDTCARRGGLSRPATASSSSSCATCWTKRLNDPVALRRLKLVYHPSVSLALLGDASIMTIFASSTARTSTPCAP